MMNGNERPIADLLKPPGSGCHASLLAAANRARHQRMSAEEAFIEIRRGIPTGNRQVPDSEIADAIGKAYSSTEWKPTRTPTSEWRRPAAPRIDPEHAFLAICRKAGMGEDPESEAFERGLHFELEPEEVASWAILKLFRPDELVFCQRNGKTPEMGIIGVNIRTASEWAGVFTETTPPEQFIINPLKPTGGRTKGDGHHSFRCDDAIAEFRYVLLEFDSKPIEDQIRFFFGSGLPIRALTHSASKSVHALVRVDAPDLDSWKDTVARLYAGMKPLGIDTSDRNQSRLSRLPGGLREGKGWQRLLHMEVADV